MQRGRAGNGQPQPAFILPCMKRGSPADNAEGCIHDGMKRGDAIRGGLCISHARRTPYTSDLYNTAGRQGATGDAIRRTAGRRVKCADVGKYAAACRQKRKRLRIYRRTTDSSSKGRTHTGAARAAADNVKGNQKHFLRLQQN